MGGSTYWSFILRPNSGTAHHRHDEHDAFAGGQADQQLAGSGLRDESVFDDRTCHQDLSGLEQLPVRRCSLRRERGGFGEIRRLGDPTDPDPSHISANFVSDRVYIEADPNVGQKRGIAANADYVTVKDSVIRVMGFAGAESPLPLTSR